MTTLSPTLPRESLTVEPVSRTPAHRISVGVGLLVYAAGGGSLIAAAASVGEADLPAVAVAVGVVVILARAAVGWREGAGLGAVAFAAIAGVPLLVLAPALDGGDDPSLVTVLAGVGLLVLAAGAASAFVPGLHAGHRESLAGALMTAGATGALAVLLAIGLAAALPVDDAGLDTLVAYVAAAAAVLALGEVLARHRCGAGFPGAPALLAIGGVITGCSLLLLDHSSGPVDAAVQAALVSSGIVTLGLLVATAAASPRPLVVPAHDAGDGPRLVGAALMGLLAVAIIARWVALRPLWIDEAALAQSRRLGWDGFIDRAATADAHPPFFSATTWLLQRGLGDGDWALRLPSLVAGVLLVPTVYATARELYDRRVAIASAIVVAIGPAMLWMSGLARPGALTALFATLALWLMLKSVRTGRFSQWVLFALASSALIWTHQLGIVHVAVLNGAILAGLLSSRRRGEPTEALLHGWAFAIAMTALATGGVLLYRGFGPSSITPPLEYATSAAPGAGRSVFGLAGLGVVAVLGFHGSAITSRLLALWPICILATFVLFGRRWSERGILLVVLSLAPFAALLALQVMGAPRNPPFALEWVATSLPILAIGLGRGLSLLGRWRDTRAAAMVAAIVLLIAVFDQTTRVDPTSRFDLSPLVDDAAAAAEPGDTIVYAPDIIGDLITRAAPDVDVVAIDDVTAGMLDDHDRVVVVGAFAFDRDQGSLPAVLSLVDDLASERELIDEQERTEAKVWTFE